MSENPQFLRTDKAIMLALVSLLKQKPFEKITVQDILDETPVTRATFYAHYHDKYEIVEKMLDYFFVMYADIKSKLRASPAGASQEIIQNSLLANRDYTEALLKVHTEKVDFRRAIASELEKEYLSSSNSPNKEAEARIYAQARTEFFLSFLNDDVNDFSLERINDIFISVAMTLLDLSDDSETKAFLKRKVSQKHP